ncbi:MAG: hypothetical protein EA397_15355 [Deltaproteobacteria bacterium]|nr:MAG: hypothetical protein EA397_15355 [Deltaproteobacteria bacterium]
MLPSLLLSLLVAPTAAHALETCPLPVQTVGPSVTQAAGALKRAKDASESQVQGDAKVVVISTGRHDERSAQVRRKVQSMLPRMDLTFLPDVDLNQEGLVNPKADSPENQPGAVPKETVNLLRSAVDDISRVQAENMEPQDWEYYADDLRSLADRVWFVDRDELRAPLFNLYYQIGRSAENAGVFGEPYMRTVDGNNINYYYFLAAALADGDSSLINASVDRDQRETIQAYLSYLETGRIDRAEIPLDLGDVWDADEFFDTYTIVLNGLELDPDSLPAKPRAALRRDGILLAAPGIIDLQLKRKDGGVGLAERLEVLKPDDGLLPIRDESRRSVAQVLARALARDLGGCSATPPSGVSSSLVLFAKQHSDPVYVAMAVDDNPADTEVWLINAERATLDKVIAPGGNFPVRFVALFGSGITINGATLREPSVSSTGRIGRPDARIDVGYVPINFHLRGHYKSLLVTTGVELGVPVGRQFADSYAVPRGHAVLDGNNNYVLKNPIVNRNVFLGAGYMHGARAGEGIGLRAIGRAAIYDVPRTIEPSIHLGWALEGPAKGDGGRVTSILDFNGFFGLMIPYGASVFENPIVNLGATVGVGTSF